MPSRWTSIAGTSSPSSGTLPASKHPTRRCDSAGSWGPTATLAVVAGTGRTTSPTPVSYGWPGSCSRTSSSNFSELQRQVEWTSSPYCPNNYDTAETPLRDSKTGVYENAGDSFRSPRLSGTIHWSVGGTDSRRLLGGPSVRVASCRRVSTENGIGWRIALTSPPVELQEETKTELDEEFLIWRLHPYDYPSLRVPMSDDIDEERLVDIKRRRDAGRQGKHLPGYDEPTIVTEFRTSSVLTPALLSKPLVLAPPKLHARMTLKFLRCAKGESRMSV